MFDNRLSLLMLMSAAAVDVGRWLMFARGNGNGDC